MITRGKESCMVFKVLTLFIGISAILNLNYSLYVKIPIACFFFGGIICDYLFLSKNNNAKDDFQKQFPHFLADLAGTSEQVLGSCSQIDDASMQQSSAVVQASTASEEISSMVERNSESIKKVYEDLNSIENNIKDSEYSTIELQKRVEDGKSNNANVVKLLKSTTALLNDLTGQFLEVVNKTGVINDIVFQTKLLSFNASVEAARAGEHGKGFAVVAEEIGNLASMSGKSAQSIQSTLEQTQLKVSQIVNDLENGSLNLSKQIENQDQAFKFSFEQFQQSMVLVQDKIKNISVQLGDVKVASEEQSRGVKEMRDSILSLNVSVQRNTLVVCQTTKLANVLSERIEHFENNYYENIEEGSDGLELSVIPWDNKYEMGVTQMDDEHKILLDKINDLITAMNTNDDSYISQTFHALKSYTIHHFTEEETYMENIGYPALESHKKVHANLLEAVHKFEVALNEGTLEKGRLASFLKNWLFTHIMGVDTKYAEQGKKASHKKVA